VWVWKGLGGGAFWVCTDQEQGVGSFMNNKGCSYLSIPPTPPPAAGRPPLEGSNTFKASSYTRGAQRGGEAQMRYATREFLRFAGLDKTVLTIPVVLHSGAHGIHKVREFFSSRNTTPGMALAPNAIFTSHSYPSELRRGRNRRPCLGIDSSVKVRVSVGFWDGLTNY